MSPKTTHGSFLGLTAAALFLLAASALFFAPASAAQSATTVSVMPASASVRVPGGMQQFDANVITGAQNRNVRWSLSGPGCSGVACGTLSETSSTSGAAITYTAPSKLPYPARVTLTATSTSNRSKKVSVTITLTGRGRTSGPQIITVKLDCAEPEAQGCSASALPSTSRSTL
jgi:hypothetical protein